jgi:putative membrane protein
LAPVVAPGPCVNPVIDTIYKLESNQYMMHYYYGNGFGFAGLGMFFTLLFWIALIWIIVSLFRQHNQAPTADSTNRALDILKERYAKGELTKKQFDEMKKDLN